MKPKLATVTIFKSANSGKWVREESTGAIKVRQTFDTKREAQKARLYFGVKEEVSK